MRNSDYSPRSTVNGNTDRILKKRRERRKQRRKKGKEGRNLGKKKKNFIFTLLFSI